MAHDAGRQSSLIFVTPGHEASERGRELTAASQEADGQQILPREV
jgi:hypothetical protein